MAGEHDGDEGDGVVGDVGQDHGEGEEELRGGLLLIYQRRHRPPPPRSSSLRLCLL